MLTERHPTDAGSETLPLRLTLFCIFRIKYVYYIMSRALPVYTQHHTLERHADELSEENQETQCMWE